MNQPWPGRPAFNHDRGDRTTCGPLGAIIDRQQMGTNVTRKAYNAPGTTP